MKTIAICKFIDGTEIGVIQSTDKARKPYTISCGNTIITVYGEEYPTPDICDKVFSKYVNAYKSGEYDNVLKKYKIEMAKLIKKVKKTF